MDISKYLENVKTILKTRHVYLCNNFLNQISEIFSSDYQKNIVRYEAVRRAAGAGRRMSDCAPFPRHEPGGRASRARRRLSFCHNANKWTDKNIEYESIFNLGTLFFLGSIGGVSGFNETSN